MSVPAILARPGRAIERLATWETLTLASDPACRAMAGAHVLVQASAPWIVVDASALSPAGNEPDDEQAVWMRLVWGRERICLLGLEHPLGGVESSEFFDDPSQDDPVGGPIVSWLVASFETAIRAEEVVVSAGVERRRPLVCRMTWPNAMRDARARQPQLRSASDAGR